MGERVCVKRLDVRKTKRRGEAFRRFSPLNASIAEIAECYHTLKNREIRMGTRSGVAWNMLKNEGKIEVYINVMNPSSQKIFTLGTTKRLEKIKIMRVSAQGVVEEFKDAVKRAGQCMGQILLCRMSFIECEGSKERPAVVVGVDKKGRPIVAKLTSNPRIYNNFSMRTREGKLNLGVLETVDLKAWGKTVGFITRELEGGIKRLRENIDKLIAYSEQINAYNC